MKVGEGARVNVDDGVGDENRISVAVSVGTDSGVAVLVMVGWKVNNAVSVIATLSSTSTGLQAEIRTIRINNDPMNIWRVS